MKTLTVLSVLVLSSVCGCASSSVQYRDLATVHNANLNAAIDRSLNKQEASDRLRVGRTHYNFGKFYYPGTSVLVVQERK